MVLEAAAGAVFQSEGTLQSQPSDGPGNIVRTAQNLAVNQHTGTNARADRQENGVAAALGAAAPGLAQDVTGTVAVYGDADALISFGSFATSRAALRKALDTTRRASGRLRKMTESGRTREAMAMSASPARMRA